MTAQEKTLTGGILSHKDRNVSLYQFYRCSSVAWTFEKPDVICKNAQVTALFILSLDRKAGTMDANCRCGKCCLIVLDRLHFKKLSKDVKTKSKLQIILGPGILAPNPPNINYYLILPLVFIHMLLMAV